MFTFTKSTNTALALLEKSSSSASYFQKSTKLQGKPILFDQKGGESRDGNSTENFIP